MAIKLEPYTKESIPSEEHDELRFTRDNYGMASAFLTYPLTGEEKLIGRADLVAGLATIDGNKMKITGLPDEIFHKFQAKLNVFVDNEKAYSNMFPETIEQSEKINGLSFIMWNDGSGKAEYKGATVGTIDLMSGEMEVGDSGYIPASYDDRDKTIANYKTTIESYVQEKYIDNPHQNVWRVTFLQERDRMLDIQYIAADTEEDARVAAQAFRKAPFYDINLSNSTSYTLSADLFKDGKTIGQVLQDQITELNSKNEVSGLVYTTLDNNHNGEYYIQALYKDDEVGHIRVNSGEMSIGGEHTVSNNSTLEDKFRIFSDKTAKYAVYELGAECKKDAELTSENNNKSRSKTDKTEVDTR